MPVLGNCWPKPPTWARHDGNHLQWVVLQQEVPIRNTVRTGGIQGRPNRGRRRQSLCPTNFPEFFSLESILVERCVCHQEGSWVRPNMGQARWLARDNPETNPVTMKPETVSHVAEQFSWVPLPCCSLPRHPFPIKSFALSAHVSPRTIHFQVLDKSPLWGPGRGPPSWKQHQAPAVASVCCGQARQPRIEGHFSSYKAHQEAQIHSIKK